MSNELGKIRREILLDLVTRFPRLSKKAIARKAYQENMSVFRNAESARRTLRYYTGNNGKESLKKISKSRIPYHNMNKKNNSLSIESIPDGETYYKDGWKPLNLECKRALVISDLHIPYYDKAATIAAIKHGKSNGCDAVMINGDFMDVHQLSNFCKDPRKKNFAKELMLAKDILKRIRDNFPGEIVYKLGNHDDRYEHYMFQKAPELLDIEALDIQSLLESDEIGITIVKDKIRIKIGKLWAIHGHELPRGLTDPVNPARGVYNKAKTNAIVGHWHRTSQHVESAMDQSSVACWSTGCLCDLHPGFMPINKWNHGFAEVEVSKDGSFEVSNYMIYNGKVL